VILLYRLSSAKFPVNSGGGAAAFGGRWNPVGTPVIYASQTASLAALEVLVHYSVLPRDFVLTEIQVPENLAIVRWEARTLPGGWDGEVVNSETQNLGAQWVHEGRAALLSVPSSIIPRERNFVINPAHPAFRRIKFLPSAPFAFDPRLKR
jgi:RES domain-containing protein